MNYTLALLHLGDRIMGGGEFVQKFPGSERPPTLAEVQEIQQRLTARGFDGIDPDDGYAGVGLLARLRQGS